MCMFCAALPMVAGPTAIAQGEQRKKIQLVESRKQQRSTDTPLLHSPELEPIESSPKPFWLTPQRITQLGALVFLGLLFGSGFYHTHFPG